MAITRRYTMRSTPKTHQQPSRSNAYGLNSTLGFLDHFDNDDMLYDGVANDDLLRSENLFSIHDKWLERRASGQVSDSDSDTSALLAFEAELRDYEEQRRLHTEGKMISCLLIVFYIIGLAGSLKTGESAFGFTLEFLLLFSFVDQVGIPIHTYLFATPSDERLVSKLKTRRYAEKTALNRSPDRVRAPRGRKVHYELYEQDHVYEEEDSEQETSDEEAYGDGHHPDWQPRRFWRESFEDAFPHWREDSIILAKAILKVARDMIIFQLVLQLFLTVIQTLGVHFYHGQDVVGIFPRYWKNNLSTQSMLGARGLGALFDHYKFVFGWWGSVFSGILGWIPRTIGKVFSFLGSSGPGIKRWLLRTAHPELNSSLGLTDADWKQGAESVQSARNAVEKHVSGQASTLTEALSNAAASGAGIVASVTGFSNVPLTHAEPEYPPKFGVDKLMQTMREGSNPKDNFTTLMGKVMKIMGFTWNSATSTWTNTTPATNRDALLETMGYTYDKHTSTWTNGTVTGLNLTIVAQEVIEQVEDLLNASMSGTATKGLPKEDPTRIADPMPEAEGWKWNSLVRGWEHTGLPSTIARGHKGDPTRTADSRLEAAVWGWNRLVRMWAFTTQPATLTPEPLAPPAPTLPAEPHTSN